MTIEGFGGITRILRVMLNLSNIEMKVLGSSSKWSSFGSCTGSVGGHLDITRVITIFSAINTLSCIKT